MAPVNLVWVWRLASSPAPARAVLDGRPACLCFQPCDRPPPDAPRPPPPPALHLPLCCVSPRPSSAFVTKQPLLGTARRSYTIGLALRFLLSRLEPAPPFYLLLALDIVIFTLLYLSHWPRRHGNILVLVAVWVASQFVLVCARRRLCHPPLRRLPAKPKPAPLVLALPLTRLDHCRCRVWSLSRPFFLCLCLW